MLYVKQLFTKGSKKKHASLNDSNKIKDITQYILIVEVCLSLNIVCRRFYIHCLELAIINLYLQCKPLNIIMVNVINRINHERDLVSFSFLVRNGTSREKRDVENSREK